MHYIVLTLGCLAGLRTIFSFVLRALFLYIAPCRFPFNVIFPQATVWILNIDVAVPNIGGNILLNDSLCPVKVPVPIQGFISPILLAQC